MRRRNRPPAVARTMLAAAATALIALIISACGAGIADEDSSSIQVVATTTQIADLVRNVGGETVHVTQILQPGSDPHGFEPRPSDVAAAATASLVFSNGQDLDPWAERLVSESGSEARLIDLSSMLSDPLKGEDLDAAERRHDHDDHAHESHEHGHEHDSEFDPHWWHDPRNAVAAIEAIAAGLAEADPDGASTYKRNARDYSRRLERLDRQIATCLARIPAERRKLVTDHEAFGYFAHRYGLEVIGSVIPAMTTQAQPSARDLSELAAKIEGHGVAAIFPEDSLSPKLAETIADQTGANVDFALYGDALGPAGSDGATYLGMLAANAGAVAAGLSAGEVNCALDVDG